jgi:PAS domain S-box-containing protein
MKDQPIMPSLKRIIDTETLQQLLERFYHLTGFRAGMVDSQGSILISTGAPDICLEFHRKNPITARRCVLSDLQVCPDQCQARGYATYRCANGLMHCGVPIVVQGQQLGTFFLGSFLLEEPDIDAFRTQAEENGFDVREYLAALKEVPIYTEDQVDRVMGFYLLMVNRIAQMGYQNVQLQEAKASLQDLKERYALALNGSQEGVWDWDLERETVYFSPRWKEILGFADHELPNDIQSWKDRIHPDDFHKAMKANMSLFNPGVDHFSVQYRMRHKSGHDTWILGRGTCIRGASGQPVRLTGTHTDITTQKEAENELRHQKKMDAVGTLAGGVAHEFNNILQGISGNVQLMQSLLPADCREQKYVRQTLEGIGRAARLIEQLLEFSQKTRVDNHGVDLNALVQNTAQSLAPLLQDSTELKVSLDPELGFIPGDPGQMEQLLHLLIHNADEAIPRERRGTVRVETGIEDLSAPGRAGKSPLQPGTYARLSISDNGCGIDPAQQHQIFDPFFTTKDPGQGTGLGLSTVYSIVKSHKGHISFSSSPDQGTMFTVLLPMTGQDSAHEAHPPGRTPVEHSNPHGRSATVLVVDDDEMVLKTVCDALEWIGISAISSESGQEMLELCSRSERPLDALVCDLEICAGGSTNWLGKVQELCPEVPVVIISGHTDHPFRKAPREHGLAAFVCKPFEHEKLISEITTAIRQPSSRFTANPA